MEIETGGHAVDTPTNDELLAKVAALEAEVAHLRAERNWLKLTVDNVLGPEADDLCRAMTEEEAAAMMAAPQGESLADIIAEFERSTAAIAL